MYSGSTYKCDCMRDCELFHRFWYLWLFLARDVHLLELTLVFYKGVINKLQ